MGKQKNPPWNSTASCSTLKCGDETLTVYQGNPRKNVCILSTAHTGVGSFSWAKAKPVCLSYYNNTKYGVDVPDQMARAYSVRGRWPVAVFYNILDLPGINAASYSRSTSSRRARSKVLQQLAEELRAEYLEGKAAATVGTRWAAAEATTAAAADTETEAVPVRKSCKWNQTPDTWHASSPCVVTVH